MQVKQQMTRKLITISPETSILKAIRIMRRHSIRHLPVVDGKKFVGFVSEFDLREVRLLPLSEDILVRDEMVKDPVTISPEESLEDAARLIFKHKIGGLPVLENGKLVGVLTSKDILAAFIEMMGVLEASSRIDVVLGKHPQAFEEISRLIKENGGNIISVGTTTHADESGKKVHFFRLEKCEMEPIVEAVKKRHYEIVSVLG